MIKQLLIPAFGRRLAFYLAAEEWVARCLSADADCFFAWRVSPTVICGRNQCVESEVDLSYCREHGIDVVRRRSGGGAVYADADNLMFSYITSAGDVDGTFTEYTSMVCSMLASLGISAEPTGRNDICVGGRKVAGNAFYRLPGRSIVHGTMLLRVDASTMTNVLTPCRDKLAAKGVPSVPSRVVGLSEVGLSMTPDQLADYACRYLCSGQMALSAADIEAIEEIEQGYYRPEYFYGRSGSPRGCQCRRRIEGVGDFEVSLRFDEADRVKRVAVSGDFFAFSDADVALTEAFSGVDHSPVALAAAAARLDTSKIIRGLTPECLAEMMAEACKNN